MTVIPALTRRRPGRWRGRPVRCTARAALLEWIRRLRLLTPHNQDQRALVRRRLHPYPVLRRARGYGPPHSPPGRRSGPDQVQAHYGVGPLRRLSADGLSCRRFACVTDVSSTLPSTVSVTWEASSSRAKQLFDLAFPARGQLSGTPPSPVEASRRRRFPDFSASASCWTPRPEPDHHRFAPPDHAERFNTSRRP